MTTNKPKNWLLVLVVFAMLVAACSDSPGSTTVEQNPGTTPADTTEDTAAAATSAPAAEPFKIGVAFPGDAPYLDGYRRGFESAAAERGVELTVLNAGWDAATQAEQMTQLISQGLDGLIVWAVDQEAICTSIVAADEAGVPMVASNSEVSETCSGLLESYTGPDTEAQGCEVGRMMSEMLGGQGSVLIIEGIAGTSPAIRRTDGFLRCLDEGIEVLDAQPGDWDKAKATTVARDLLTRHGDQVAAIYGHDDTMAVGAAEAVAEAGLEDILLVGIGGSGAGLDAIRDGVLEATIIQSPVTDGSMPVHAIVDFLEGKTIEPLQILPMPRVTEDNVDDYEAEW